LPTYDWKCEVCDMRFEAQGQMSCAWHECPLCGDGFAVKQFSPNKNILIPGHFRMDRGWHLPPEGSQATSPDANSRVQAKPRESFKQKFDKNWAKAGGS
jgi:putative FmdB family regulatory protein